jgi:hypothetical protein
MEAGTLENALRIGPRRVDYCLLFDPNIVEIATR